MPDSVVEMTRVGRYGSIVEAGPSVTALRKSE